MTDVDSIAPSRTKIANLPHWFKTLNVFRQHWLIAGGLFLLTFLVYWLSARLFGWALVSTGSYWNLLADALLHGRLYVINPPSTYDLTQYNGRWFVPNPPLPGLLALPYVWFLGLNRADPLIFSYFFCALNAVLIFFMLEAAAERGWVQVSHWGRLALVGLVIFGTPHWFVGVNGRMWFISQILTVTFTVLGAYLTIKEKSPWWIGVSLGAAVLSRSNVFVLWVFLFTMALQIWKEKTGKLDWKQVIYWAIASGVPVIIAIFILMGYNLARFGNPLDFGYVTINGDPRLVSDVKAYGMFNLHFIPANLRAMLFNLPDLKKTYPFIDFPIDGMSMLITTPALIYLFRRVPKGWGMVGAWVSILLSLALLVTYHNTGRAQFGYRYLLDFIAPVILVIAVALPKKVPWLFLALTLISIGMNAIGMVWFIGISNQ